ncbi:tRNA methyltransferase PPM2 [Lachancea thermotolerans CBS 6340]|uniref:tRNA wybutosine-synthesizing protein 4 n=1 Tax=Lachancea thermotolerans (strain ATCC 56472 / CBS 6340 / NRRL Y-8284) TaxID=559295 RepID=C5DJV9_LACTC|nr:KLTH0F19514p [Lachancea thermotolerans CBS 6340]CAR24598.1 KLTH0F19514p [Lachancea thermotolerans CBS 6340]
MTPLVSEAGNKQNDLTPRQARQAEKLERRKKYADLAIQGTNNSSIASKRSVERLYLHHMDANRNVDENKGCNEYFKYFVNKALRRSPCINRGYWLRIYAIKSKIDSIAASTNKPITVINLGCGFDPLPFQLLDSTNKENAKYGGRLSFVDLDYPDLLLEKKKIIEKTPELQQIVGKLIAHPRLQNVLQGRQYLASPCDLNKAGNFVKLMEGLELNDPNKIKIFVAEVSLAYMSSEKSNAIILSCSKMPNSHFVVLEQLVPAGPSEPFSRRMLYHFKKNDSPLQSVLDHQTKATQEQRFRSYGFPHTNIGNMYQLWESIDDDIKQKVESVEPFDELEEFLMFCHHYVIGHATNDQNFEFCPKLKQNEELNPSELLIKDPPMDFLPLDGSDFLQRKFGSAAILPNNEIIYTQGCFSSRLKDTLLIDPVLRSIRQIDPELIGEAPPERMCHTLTSLSENLCVLVGGRGGPKKPYSDLWLLHRKSPDSWQWTAGPSLPETRFRHGACSISDTQVLIFGGVSEGQPFLIYDAGENNLTVPRVEGSIPLVASPGLAYNKKARKGAITGGADKDGSITGAISVFSYDETTKTIKIEKQLTHPAFKRYGCKTIFIDDDRLLIVGGFSPDVLFDQHSTVVEACLTSGKVNLVRIPTAVWEEGIPLMAGFELQMSSQRDVYIFGGGAVCYGFGAVWNGVMRIRGADLSD